MDRQPRGRGPIRFRGSELSGGTCSDLKGTVISPAGQPTPDAIVRLIPQQSAAHSIIPSAIADKQGAFNIGGGAPGAYYLYAPAGCSSGFSFNQSFIDIAGGSSARFALEVTDRDIENVAVAMKPRS